MKQYPRIYTLSTVGLIHHQEFDYLFHPFRTDFIGESGSGKSMIADLIQLIFVGSDAYESATRATSKREPEGMVLTQGANIKVTGYAFLNIEMKPGKYLVVGCCIESGNRNTQAFIIQKGYSWDAIEYLDLPISNLLFLQDDQILPIDSFKEVMIVKGLFCQSWIRIKKFHEILYEERILPIDLAASDKHLKDYADILQSFSRGKMLDIQKSSSIKNFLFGNHAGKEIHEKYKAAVRDMEAAVGEYGTNLKEIVRVTKKQQALIELKGAKEESDIAEKIWAEKKLFFFSQEVNTLETEIKNLITDYANAKQHVGILQNLLVNEVQSIENQLPVLEQQREKAYEAYEEILPIYMQIRKVESWLKEADCTPKQLEVKYADNKLASTQKKLIEELVVLLKEKGVSEEFDKIDAKQSFTALGNYLIESLAKLQEDIQHKESLRRFSDVRNPDSLAAWAIEQNRAFSLEEESVILGFQGLARKKPNNNEDYLPSPNDLFQALRIVEKQQNGFWINLAGIHKYVKYISTPVFHSGNKDELINYFVHYSNNMGDEISALKIKFDQQTVIQGIVHSLKSPSDTIKAYNLKEQLLALKVLPALNVATEIFEDSIRTYNDAENVKGLYDQARKQNEESGERLNKAKGMLESYRHLNLEVANNIDSRVLMLLQQKEYADLLIAAEKRGDDFKENISSEFRRTITQLDLFGQNKAGLEKRILLIRELPEKDSRFQETIVKFQKAQSHYLKLFNALPETLISNDYVTEPRPEWETLIKAQQLYIDQYKSLIQHYIPSEGYKLTEENNFSELAKNLLPEAFHQVFMLDKTDEDIIESIATYLNRINEKNRRLNNRKIQKIKDLLAEVDLATTAQENIVRRIDNFLKNEANITGGYRARLKKHAAISYPREWINNFIEKLEDDYATINTTLSDKVDIENMMLAAFLNCGGSKNTEVSAPKLLDPSAYFELEFRMESETGRINKGSTGQTYAAIALLCIARLWVMSNVEGKKVQPAVRVMPIDEAEGLGSNYDMLHDIAKNYDYQLVSLSINPVGQFKDGEQFIYILHKNLQVEEPVNYTPVAVLSNRDKLFDSSNIV